MSCCVASSVRRGMDAVWYRYVADAGSADPSLRTRAFALLVKTLLLINQQTNRRRTR